MDAGAGAGPQLLESAGVTQGQLKGRMWMRDMSRQGQRGAPRSGWSLGSEAPSDEGVLLFSITSLRVQDATRVTQQLLGTHRVHLILGDQHCAVAGDIRFPKGPSKGKSPQMKTRSSRGLWSRGYTQHPAQDRGQPETEAPQLVKQEQPTSAPHFCGGCAAFHNTRCPSGLILQRAPPNPSALAS